jgi:formylglycine-generating enzyme required for sulfatase activity
VAWYEDNSGNSTHAVGTKKPNGLGLYDMSGNVHEWCWDWYGAYNGRAQTDPAGAVVGDTRVIRGGSWGSNASYVRSVNREYESTFLKGGSLGIRLVRPL